MASTSIDDRCSANGEGTLGLSIMAVALRCDALEA
jgi:hypothetical protein